MEEPYAEIPLTKGYVVKVDPDDWLWLSQWEWQALVNVKKTGIYVYGSRSASTDGHKRHVLMHREILRAPQNLLVDHRNHDTLDNRRSNIRLATHSQNMANRRVAWGLVGYKGVQYVGGPRPWKAALRKAPIDITVGYFLTAEEAAAAYDKAAVEIHGEFAKTNAQILEKKLPGVRV